MKKIHKKLIDISIKDLSYQEYLDSSIWQIKRKIFLKELGNRCFYCGKSDNLNVHHKDYNNIGFETKNNVRIVCNKCHREIHGIEEAKNDKLFRKIKKF